MLQHSHEPIKLSPVLSDHTKQRQFSSPNSADVITTMSNDNTTFTDISTVAETGVVTDSICNKNNGSKADEPSSSAGLDKEKNTLEVADELMTKGSEAVKAGDLGDAVDFYSRALEIRVEHYGELAPECVKAYYKYGLALLYKAQDEADPLVSAPKSGVAQEDCEKDKEVDAKSLMNGESSTTSVASNTVLEGESKEPEVANGKGLAEEQEDDDGDDSDGDNSGDGEEDDSDLDLAWKMLDVARAIVEKVPGDTMEKVDILSTLAEVALEREDMETSLNDYLNALSILERLVEPDSRLIAELNFRVCLCLEMGSKADEAIAYCQKAISVCKSRVDRLKKEVNNKSHSQTSSAVEQRTGQPSETDTSEIEAEIETLTGLTSDLEKKLEDLQQLVANPSSVLSEIMEIMSARGKGNANGALAGASSSCLATAGSSGEELQSPTVSTAHTNGQEVTNLGVVGRGVKRVSTNSEKSDTKQAKRIAPTPVEKSEGGSL